MNLKTQRNILAVVVVALLITLGVLIGTGSLSGAAGGQGKGKGNTQGLGKNDKGQDVIVDEENFAVDFSAIPAGTSVVGTGLVYPGMTIDKSGGNDVYKIAHLEWPSAYGANYEGGINVVPNACAFPGGGIVDLGLPGTTGLASSRSRNHAYTFTFDNPIGSFQIGVLDWGDYMPFGACPGGVCSMEMTAYNAAGEVVGQSVKSFHSTSSAANNRVTDEYGDLQKPGDACSASEGAPGRFIIKVNGSAITRVTLGFANKESMDPNIALWLGPFQTTTPEGTGTQGYWRNHVEKWPVSSLTIGGTTYNIADAIAIMDQAGKGDKTYDLFAQYVAAKLNTLAGNDDSCIREDLTAAENWFNENPVGSGVDADSDAWSQISQTHTNLDDYNNGLLCAPHRD